MYPNASEVKANLVEGPTTIPIDVKFSSKYSLLIRSRNGNSFDPDTEFSKLVLEREGERIELGRCRILPEPNHEGYAGRLIFTRDVYDLESLLFHNKLVRLQNAFLNLPLILAHKHKISQSFKNYTANLTYDLSVYKNLFDSLDAEYADEPENIKASLQETIIAAEGRKFMAFLDDKLQELARIVRNFSREEHERHGFYFRKQLWNFIRCAPFMARTNLKPRGYAGDSEMMSMIYANDYWGDSTFAKLLHKHPIEHPAAQAVRNRRHVIGKIIEAMKSDGCRNRSGKQKILSVACGPARELEDILLAADDCRGFHFALLDQDRAALHEAAKLVDQIESKLNTHIGVDYLNESVRTMLATPQLKTKLGQFHFVYSMGLFDYLTPPVASAVLGKLYQLLKPGGEMVIGNYHISNPGRHYMEYWLDWVLFYRTEEDFKHLLKDAPDAEVDVFFDDTGVQMFLRVKKKRKMDSDSSFLPAEV
ncbi:MAG: class I SAM-dependent methyltransferase [Desulfobacterales bacterium]|nr:MAG: class I SAM-dependent methyltransferase [Desulfobacterales bacterium]